MLESAYLNSLIARAKQDVKTIVLPEGEDERILKAAHLITGRKSRKGHYSRRCRIGKKTFCRT